MVADADLEIRGGGQCDNHPNPRIAKGGGVTLLNIFLAIIWASICFNNKVGASAPPLELPLMHDVLA